MDNNSEIIKIIKVGDQDTPRSLAQHFYGDAGKFQIILDCNDLTMEKWKVGIEIKIPRLPAPLEETPVRENSRLVKSEVANLEGRKLLRENIDKLYGVSKAAVQVLKEQLKITSIFDLAMSHYFNSALRLVDPATPLEAAFVQHGFIPGDTVQKAPSLLKVSVLADDKISELHFENAATADQLKDALQITTIRDMALWPPFQNARQILLSTFDPMELTRRGQDSEAPADLVPACGNFPTECVYYTSVFLDEIDSQGAMTDLSTSEGVSLFGENDKQGFTKPAKGGILTYKQSWYAQGVTLGQLLHSLALAPGESTRIAMVDWYRRTGEKVSEEIAESDVLSQTSQQSRSISEITTAVANEMQFGSNTTSASSKSSRGGVGGAMGLLFGFSGGRSSNSSVATSVSSSFGQRNMAAEMNQRILSSTQQNATAERSRRATIVRECYQEEKEKLTTRVVANYNHMHALTVQYYEVVQVYRVSTELLKAERVLFIPMKPINFGDERVFARYKELLKTVAVNDVIQNKLDAWKSSYANLKLGSVKQRIHHSPELQSIQYTSDVEIAKIHVIKTDGKEDLLPDSNFGKSGIKVWESAIPLSDLKQIKFDFKQIDVQAEETETPTPSCSLTYKFKNHLGQEFSFDEEFNLIVDPSNRVKNKPQTFIVNPVTVLIVENFVRELEDTDAFDLIEHLQETPRYSHAIWLNLDSLTLSQMLAGYKYGEEDKPLASQIDPTPVAITGNYLGFRWNFGSQKNEEDWLIKHNLYSLVSNKSFDTVTEEEEWQKKVKAYSTTIEAEIPLPSGGVFAEAVLGRFNSAEKLDITRYWNWQDSPIPFAASDIAALTAGGKSEQSTLTPGQLSQPAVTINTAASLPEPTGMRDMMQAIAASNMFRDMSNQAATAALAGQGLEIASKGAGEAAQQASENYRTYVNMVGDVAKEVIPLVATGGLSGASISKAGAVANLAGKIDEKKGKSTDGNGTGSQQTVLKSIIGGVTKATETEKGETEE